MSDGRLPFSIKLQKFVGHVFHGLAHARLGLGPRLRTQVTERGLRAFRRAIFLNQVETRERDVEPRALGVFEQHELGVAIALIDFLQALILADAVFDVNDVVADLQVAEVRKERRDFRLLTLRARSHRIRFIKQIPSAEDGEVRFREQRSIGNIGFRERRGENFAGEVAGLVGITFAPASAASQAERNVVFGKDVGQALNFTGIGHGKQHLISLSGKLLHFFEHHGNRAVEARSGLG